MARRDPVAMAGVDGRIVIVLPSLEETLRHSSELQKRAMARHTQAQHRQPLKSPATVRVDRAWLTIPESLRLVEEVIGRYERWLERGRGIGRAARPTA